jgi:hypothetical protein
MQSIYRRSTLFTLRSSCPETKHQIFRHEEGVREQFLGFLYSSTGCSEISPLHITTTRLHQTKTATLDKRLHCIQTESTYYKKVLLQPHHVSSKHQLPMSYTVTAVTILWPFVQTFETLIFWAWKFSATFSSSLILETELY